MGLINQAISVMPTLIMYKIQNAIEKAMADSILYPASENRITSVASLVPIPETDIGTKAISDDMAREVTK